MDYTEEINNDVYTEDSYTEEINKTALSYNDDKRLIVFDGITTYPYGILAGILCK